mmetsp:Transcript_11475/g.15932  ORF Transcript_11475/g.15932 Transcript_11475/m.15932 type:complete len:361 (-) Transcript_11475:25-1107(-)
MDNSANISLQNSQSTDSTDNQRLSLKRRQTHVDATGARTVVCRMRIPELYQVDTATWMVSIAINLHLFWKDPSIIGKVEDEINWDSVWKPDLEILNAFEVNEESVFELLDSSSGSVRQKIKYRGTITNYMNLADFPFDEDDIVIQIRPKKATEKEMKLELDSRIKPEELVGYEAAIGLTDWLVGTPTARIDSQYRSSNDTYVPVIHMEIPIKRLYEFYLVRVLLILLLIVVMSWTTFSVDTLDFTGRLGINLTLFLAAVAFLFVIAEGLPKLPYLTALDRLLTISFLALFLTVAENWVVFMLARNEKTAQAERVDEVSAAVIPALYFLASLHVLLKVRWNKAKRAHIKYLDPLTVFQGRS